MENGNVSWRKVGRLPRPLAYGVSVSWGDSVICIGGSDAERHYADAFTLTWRDGQLSEHQLPPLPIPLSGACGALGDDVVFVAGGSLEPGEQSASNRCFALDLAAKERTWREIAPLPGAGRLLPVAATHSGTFYVIGGAALHSGNGRNSRIYLKEVWSFKSDEGWRQLADLPKPRVAAPSPAPVLNGRILLVAGDDGSRADFQPVAEHPGFPANILAYDIGHDRWTDAGETPAPRATLPSVQWRDLFVFPSGEVRPGRRSPEVWALSPR